MPTTFLLFDLSLLGFFVAACAINARRPVRDRHPDIWLDEMHHGYLGDCLVLVGWAFGAWWLAVPGLLARLDDTVQHVTQLSKPQYESPLHQFYVTVFWRYECVRRFNHWLDRVLGSL